MKKRVVQITKVSKTVDKRLEVLEKRLERVNKMILKLEKLLDVNPKTTRSITYTIQRKS